MFEMCVKLFSLFLLLFFGGCAKQPRNFFSFDDEVPKKNVSSFQFPSVSEFRVIREGKNNQVTWKKILHPDCIGYTIYRFSSLGFISKEPVARLLGHETSWIDEHASASTKVQYIIRGVFTKENEQVEGPSSALVGL